MSGHRGQAELPPPLGRQRPAVTVAVELEPQDRRAQQAALAQIVAHPRFDGAQILTDDHRAGAVGLQRDDADHRVVVVADIGAVRSAGRPRESTTTGTSPMMWSMRTPPAWRRIAAMSARNGW